MRNYDISSKVVFDAVWKTRLQNIYWINYFSELG
jgi:hypothetical protein